MKAQSDSIPEPKLEWSKRLAFNFDGGVDMGSLFVSQQDGSVFVSGQYWWSPSDFPYQKYAGILAKLSDSTLVWAVVDTNYYKFTSELFEVDNYLILSADHKGFYYGTQCRSPIDGSLLWDFAIDSVNLSVASNGETTIASEFSWDTPAKSTAWVLNSNGEALSSFQLEGESASELSLRIDGNYLWVVSAYGHVEFQWGGFKWFIPEGTNITKYNLNSGEKIWRVVLEGEYQESATFDKAGNCYISTSQISVDYSSKFSKFDAEGNRLWRVSSDASTLEITSSAFSTKRDIIAFGGWEKRETPSSIPESSAWFTILNASDGSQYYSKIWDNDSSKWSKTKGCGFDTLGNLFVLSEGSVDYLQKYSFPTISVVENGDPNLPSSFSLSQNYPNPFNPNTNIAFSVPKTSLVIIAIYDALGREVNTLVRENMSAGTHEVSFNARHLPSGIYFCRMISGSFSETKKMVLMK